MIDLHALRGAAVACLVLAGSAGIAAAQATTTPCTDSPGFEKLDFWIGEWAVFVDDSQVGTNRIESILQGCAVMEHWRDMNGNEGKSLFFFNPVTSVWKQVWVTEAATQTGGLKEKTLVEELENGGLRFQGEIPLPDGSRYFDRTTLTPLPDGTVRQVIEVSRDGETWEATFDAIYRRTR